MAQMLFICTGNVCRSAYAEREAARIVPGDAGWEFASAGVAALAGRPMDQLMADELAARGGDPAGFVARQIDRGIIGDADLIVGMEAYHRQVVLDDHPALVRRTFTLGQLAGIVQGFPELSGADLVEAVGARRHRVRDEDDIADPYRRGPQPAAHAAAQISDLLDQILPRLTA